jgi:hypothetical protein
MPRDFVIVPAFKRPEMLELSLQHLFRCPEADDAQVTIYIDKHVGELPDPACWEVARGFPVERVERESHTGKFDIRNVMGAFQDAQAAGAEYTFLVEEDVLVAVDYFHWHHAVLAQEPDAFASIGRHPNLIHFKSSGISTENYAILSAFSCVGSCFPNRTLPIITRHATPEFYSDPRSYVQRTFAETSPEGYSYDGILQREMRRQGLGCIWPAVARAQHIGIYGLHRGFWQFMEGKSWEQKRDILREHLTDSAWMNQHFGDCEVADLGDKQWEKPRRVNP